MFLELFPQVDGDMVSLSFVACDSEGPQVVPPFGSRVAANANFERADLKPKSNVRWALCNFHESGGIVIHVRHFCVEN